MKYYVLIGECTDNFFCLTDENHQYKLFVNNEFLFAIDKNSDFENFPIIKKILAEGGIAEAVGHSLADIIIRPSRKNDSRIEALKKIEIFCKETFKQPKNWSLEAQKSYTYDKDGNVEYLLDRDGELVLKGLIFVIYPSELLQGVFPPDILLGRYYISIKYLSKWSNILEAKVEGYLTQTQRIMLLIGDYRRENKSWVQLISTREESDVAGDIEGLKILVPEASKIMETILNCIRGN